MRKEFFFSLRHKDFLGVKNLNNINNINCTPQSHLVGALCGIIPVGRKPPHGIPSRRASDPEKHTDARPFPCRQKWNCPSVKES